MLNWLKKLIRLLTPLIILGFIHLIGISSIFGPGENIVLFFANTACLFFAIIYKPIFSRYRFTLYCLGWAFGLGTIFLRPDSAPVMALYLAMYSALFRTPRLLCHFGTFVMSIEMTPQYFTQIWPLAVILIETLYYSLIKERDKLSSIFFLLGFMLIGMILIPVLGILFSSSPQTLATTWQESVVQNALATSLLTATTATIITLIFGIPLAYAIAKTKFYGREIILTLIDLPILVPQSVAGIALLMVFGPKTTIGLNIYNYFGLEIVNSLFAITIAQIFVSAPFLLRAATATFSESDHRLEKVSRALGATHSQTFWRISLPMALPGIYGGAVLTWARAISEAGTIILLANEPFTISTLVNFRFQQFGTEEAAPIASLLIIICLFIFTILNCGKFYLASNDSKSR